MAVPRKMLGKTDDPAVKALMELIGGQSWDTLAAWAGVGQGGVSAAL